MIWCPQTLFYSWGKKMELKTKGHRVWKNDTNEHEYFSRSSLHHSFLVEMCVHNSLRSFFFKEFHSPLLLLYLSSQAKYFIWYMHTPHIFLKKQMHVGGIGIRWSRKYLTNGLWGWLRNITIKLTYWYVLMVLLSYVSSFSFYYELDVLFCILCGKSNIWSYTKSMRLWVFILRKVKAFCKTL